MAWSEDFSYDFYGTLLDTMQENYEMHMVSEAAKLKYKGLETDSLLFLRHDIDVSPEKAVKMARFEFDRGVKSTYYVRLHSKFYEMSDEKNIDHINHILSMNHDIGLHYDSKNDGDIWFEFQHLADIIEKPVLSTSFHIPSKEQMEMGLNCCGRVNAYAQELRVRYKSDSSGRWRDGNPLEELKDNTKPIQIAIHPIWWGAKTISTSMINDIVPKLDEGW
jgi:hypothetical protein